MSVMEKESINERRIVTEDSRRGGAAFRGNRSGADSWKGRGRMGAALARGGLKLRPPSGHVPVV